MNKFQLARLVQLLMRGGRAKGGRRWMLLAVAAVVAYVLLRPALERQFGISLPDILDSDGRPAQTATTTRSDQRSPGSSQGLSPGEEAILSAFDSHRSDVIVEASATVKKRLRDDDIEPRHQKMILRLSSGHTVLLAHNIDLAPRVPAEEGDTITFKGEYEYSEQGGVIHWTHHDPGGRHPGGWIEYRGQRYE